LVLWNRCQALVEEETKAPVVSADHELPPPQVRAPMSHRLNQADEFSFIGGEFGVARRNGLAEEGQRTCTLMQHDTHARTRRVTLDDEVAVERRKLQNWS
jgi:hypothetical protein